MWHDTNKIYAMLRSCPLGVVITIPSLEDQGVDTNTVSFEHQAKRSRPTASHWPKLMGGSWVDNDGKSPSPDTRVALVTNRDNQQEWELIVFELGDVLGPEMVWDMSRLVLKAAGAGMRLRDCVAIPFFIPMRLDTPQGIIFVG
eukprot:jgi/Mesvir1/1446/Mv14437-RA.1